MPPKIRKTPNYRLHKPTGQAVVRLDGRDIYLGKFNSPESWQKYGRVIAEWRTGGTTPVPARATVPASQSEPTADLSVAELILAYYRHAETYYRRDDGSHAPEWDNLKLALRPLKELYGDSPAVSFGPLKLKSVRQSMIDDGLDRRTGGLSRRTINQRIGRIIRVFSFGVENELIPAVNLQALQTVPGLKQGRSGVKADKTVKPVPDEHVEAVKPFLSRQLWAVVELQRLTGARSGEILMMRSGDIDTSGTVWEYVPKRHKTMDHGKARRIPIGPRAQAVLKPWLRSNPMEYLFQPREAMDEVRAERKQARKTPLTPSQRNRKRKAKPEKTPGTKYDTRTFNHAVHRACDRANVPHWHPHQLRHNAATNIRKEFGVEVARVILGHGSIGTTEIYAEADREKAVKAMERAG